MRTFGVQGHDEIDTTLSSKSDEKPGKIDFYLGENDDPGHRPDQAKGCENISTL
jgi:hypothetical protein